MKNQNGFIAAAVASALSAPVYATEVSLSGAVEVELGIAENYAGAKVTDVTVATATLGVDAQINDRVSATLAFLYEEDATAFGLDEGYVTLHMNTATSLTAGRIYVPFGSFDSNMVSDPLTLELGETSETAIMLGMGSGEVSGSLYTFNGDAGDNTATDNDELSFGANIAYATDSLTVGASYISNIADTDGLQPATDIPGQIKSAVAGMGVNFGMNMNNFSIIAEHIAAADSFANGDILANGGATVANQETPTASNIELAFDTGNAVIAAAYQTTNEALFLGLPESATSVAVSFDVMDGAGMGIEYISKNDYSVSDGGTGEIETAITVQLGVEF